MPLNSDVTKTSLDRTEDGGYKHTRWTEAIVFECSNIGMSEITQANHREWFRRSLAFRRVIGAATIPASEVVKHIGLTTNARPMSAAKFKASLYPWISDRAADAAWERTLATPTINLIDVTPEQNEVHQHTLTVDSLELQAIEEALASMEGVMYNAALDTITKVVPPA